jgi:hypothetical protein
MIEIHTLPNIASSLKCSKRDGDNSHSWSLLKVSISYSANLAAVKNKARFFAMQQFIGQQRAATASSRHHPKQQKPRNLLTALHSYGEDYGRTKIWTADS